VNYFYNKNFIVLSMSAEPDFEDNGFEDDFDDNLDD